MVKTNVYHALTIDYYHCLYYKHDIPTYFNMNISKLKLSGVITTDTCNSARKTRRLLFEKIIDASKIWENKTV